MARSLVKNPNTAIAEFLKPLNMAEVHRITGIPQSTLCRYKKKPWTMPMAVGIEIAKAVGMRNEDWCRLRG